MCHLLKKQNDVDIDELPNEEVQRYYSLLPETNKLLFDGSPNSKLSMCVRFLGLNSQFHVSNTCLDFMTNMMLNATPIWNDTFPTSYYDSKILKYI